MREGCAAPIGGGEELDGVVAGAPVLAGEGGWVGAGVRWLS